jgi:hypothetical protein
MRNAHAASSHGTRPPFVTVLGGMCLVNAVAAAGVGLATLAGARLLYAPLGAGTGRVAPAALLGPLASYAGWVLVALGAGAAWMGVGLLRLRAWARRLLLGISLLAAAATLAAVGWGLAHAAWDVVVSGAVKVALYAALALYLRRPAVRAAFAAQTI